jgi:Tol biopolymer transport system component
MDADGSNVIQLTDGEGDYYLDLNGYTPWSPDGKKLIFFHEDKLSVMDITDKNITTLTNEPEQYFDPSWSPDGRYIAFTSDPGRNPRDLFVVGSDGNHLTKLTETLSGGEFFLFDYAWSQDGTSITFATSRSTVYEANVDGFMTVIHETTDGQIIDWWNGITVQQGETHLSWIRPDGSQSALDLCPLNSHLLSIAHKRSYGGNLVFGSNCSDNGWMLYWANADGTIVNELLSSPIPTKVNTDHITDIAWSPDDQYIVFVSSDTASPGVTEALYILDVAKAREDPSIQPLKMPNSFGPSWQPVP